MSKNIIKAVLLFALSPLAMAQTFVSGQVLTAAQLNAALGAKASIVDLAGASASKGAAMVGFSHATTYSDGTLGARLRNVVFVTDPPYLSKCDGATNDAAAIASAIAAVGGGTVVIPDGRTCAIGSTLTLSATGAALVSNGGTLKKLNAADAIVLTGVNNKVIGVRIDGNAKGGSGVGIKGRQGTVSSVISYNHGSHGIYADGQSTGCWQNDISNNEAYGNGEVGIAQNKCVENRIVGNNVHDNNFEGITVDNQANNGVVANNHVINNNLTGGVGGIGIDYSSYVTITGNVIERSQSSKPGIKTQNNLGASSYLNIVGNSFNSNTGGGIWFYSNGVLYTNNSTISSNVFDSVGTNAITIDAGSDNNIVIGNSLGGGAFVNNASGTAQFARTDTGQTFNGTQTFGGTLSATGAVSGSGFSTYLASPPAIGSTAPGTGKFTTLLTTGNAGFGATSASWRVDILGSSPGMRVRDSGSTNGSVFQQVAGGNTYINVQDAADLIFNTSAATRATIKSSGNVLIGTSTDNGSDKLQVNGGIKSISATAGVGYAAGAGGAVTQASSKTTGVTLNTVTGQVTMNASALAAAATACFTLTNSAVAAADVVSTSISSGATAGAYTIQVDAIAAGSARLCLNNRSAGSLSEAVVINFAVLKGSAN